MWEPWLLQPVPPLDLQELMESSTSQLTLHGVLKGLAIKENGFIS